MLYYSDEFELKLPRFRRIYCVPICFSISSDLLISNLNSSKPYYYKDLHHQCPRTNNMFFLKIRKLAKTIEKLGQDKQWDNFSKWAEKLTADLSYTLLLGAVFLQLTLSSQSTYLHFFTRIHLQSLLTGCILELKWIHL